jgi:hypothetical protein
LSFSKSKFFVLFWCYKMVFDVLVPFKTTRVKIQ